MDNLALHGIMARLELCVPVYMEQPRARGIGIQVAQMHF
jgi:hypothetical protein